MYKENVMDNTNSMSAPKPPDESEVKRVIQVLQNQTVELIKVLEMLASRLQPILPEAQPKITNAPGEERIQGNMCPLSRAIENCTYDVNDAIMKVHILLEEIRI